MNVLTHDYYQKHYLLSEQHALIVYQIGLRVEKLWEAHVSLPYYTTHGPSHNITIIELLTKILPVSMNDPYFELDRYILLVSAWLHDVGMLDLDFFTEQYRHSEVRAKHHERSARWLLHNAVDLGLSAPEADAVAFLVKMHRKKEKLEVCPEEMFLGARKVRSRLISALLRLADGLHVDETRAPLKEYSLYKMTGMPSEAKFHWIKARAVQGLDIDPKQGTIRVQIGIPGDKETGEVLFRPLGDFIKEEIDSELETVRGTLAKEGSPLFSDVKVELIKIPGLNSGSNRAKEIEELNNLISIDVSPNARRLTTVILKSIEQIRSPDQGGVTAKYTLEALQNLKDYAKDLLPKVVARRCHVPVVKAFVALVKLLNGQKKGADWESSLSLSAFLQEINDKVASKKDIEKDLENAIDEIDFPQAYEDCKSILDSVSEHFKQAQKIQGNMIIKLGEILKNNLNNTDKNGISPVLTPDDRILLYGTSESVLDVLKEASTIERMKESLEIFIAECRVKSNYSSTNNIIYNDGIEYTRRIREFGYMRTAIIPDAAVAHMLLPKEYYEKAAEPEYNEQNMSDWKREKRPVSKVFLGFNGLNVDEKFAIHSCGHLAVALMAKGLRPRGDPNSEISTESEAATSNAKLYLVGTTNKCGIVKYKHTESRAIGNWLMGNTAALDNNIIGDHNPIDDIIKLDLVDYIISDLGISSPDDFVNEYKQHNPIGSPA